jgi:hypothetical protein
MGRENKVFAIAQFADCLHKPISMIFSNEIAIPQGIDQNLNGFGILSGLSEFLYVGLVFCFLLKSQILSYFVN